MQENDAVVMLDGIQMDIANAGNAVWQYCQFEVMGGKQRIGLQFFGNKHRRGPGQRQAIKGTGTATNLVHEHQALGRGVVQDIGRFRHFHHKGRAATGEIV